MNGRHRNILKKSAEDHLENYDKEMIDDLQNQITDYLYAQTVEDVDHEEIETIISNWKDKLPDPGEWAGDQAYNDYEDAMEDRCEKAID